MPSGIVKNQHYVPQAYLRHFANPKEQIWVYDKQKRRAFQTNIRNVASEMGFYDSDAFERITGDRQFIERHLTNIEGQYATVVDSILINLRHGNFRELKPRPRHFLSAYMAVQMMRTKESRITSIQMMETMRAILKKTCVDAGREPPPDEELMDGMSPEDAARDIQNRSLLDGAMIQKMATILFRHIWIIQEAFGNEQFLTSDHPFAKRPHITDTWCSMSGIASTGIEIVFPLSPRFLLTLCERNHFQKMQRFDGQRLPLVCHDNMIYNNQFQVYDSNRFVFSQNGEFSYVEQILRENPIHGNPNKMRVATNQDDALGRLGGLHKD